MSQQPSIYFDRAVSDELLEFLTTPPWTQLVSLGGLHDLQLRSDRPKGVRSWATLYYGLTSLLDIVENGGRFRLETHQTYQKVGRWDRFWSEWMLPEQLWGYWDTVEAHLEHVRPNVNPNFTAHEGVLHAALTSGASDAFRVLNREASPSFADQATKDRIKAEVWGPISDALRDHATTEAWWPRQMVGGQSLDILAVDIGGRLALIEAKHHTATGMIAKAAAQVGSYARLYAYLLQADPRRALERIDRMLEQRIQIGATRRGVLYLTEPLRLAPIVAIGPERPTKEARRRLWELGKVLDGLPQPWNDGNGGRSITIEPLEVWYVDHPGRINAIERAGDIQPQRPIGPPAR
jgi:hypothetical protein